MQTTHTINWDHTTSPGCGHPGGRAMGTCPATWPAGSPRPVAAYCRADGGAVPTTLSPNVPPPASLYSPGWDADEVAGGSVGGGAVAASVAGGRSDACRASMSRSNQASCSGENGVSPALRSSSDIGPAVGERITRKNTTHSCR